MPRTIANAAPGPVGLLPVVVLQWWLFLGLHGTVDPYALWALATNFRTLKRAGDDQSTDVFSFAVEMDEPYDSAMLTDLLVKARSMPAEFLAKLGGKPPPFPVTIGERVRVEVPDTFKDRKSRFLTVRVDWAEATPDERYHAVAFLTGLTFSFSPSERAPVKRMQIGDPRGSKNPDREDPGDPPSLQLPHRPRLVLGVIEDDGAFAHAAVRATRNGAATRAWTLWDQSTMRECVFPWASPYKNRYGCQLDQVTMNVELAKHHDGRDLDEEATYSDLGVNMPRLLRRGSHGAAVTSLFTGAWRAAPQMPQQPDADSEAELADHASADAASVAPLIMVQLPEEQTTLSSGRWLAVNALDALRYILDVARSRGGTPCVVDNMSYGAMAGPHDGSGMLEQAIDDLVASYKHDGGDLVVVLAAGNSGGILRDAEDDGAAPGASGQRVPGGAHARTQLPTGGRRSFTLFIPPDKQTETHVELWFDRVFGPGLHDPGVSVVVTPPVGTTTLVVRCSESKFWPPDEGYQAGLLFNCRVPQGDNRSMALLCVAATQVSSTRVCAPAGRWRIDVIDNLARPDTGPLPVEAWVERDDTVVGARRGQSARFVAGTDAMDGVMPDDSNTFTNVATGDRSFPVGAVHAQEFALDDRAACYSATGASAVRGPLLSAVTEAGQALRGIRVSGSQSGMVVRSNGTSMAAPQAARWIANQLAAGRTIEDVRLELENSRTDARVGHIV